MKNMKGLFMKSLMCLVWCYSEVKLNLNYISVPRLSMLILIFATYKQFANSLRINEILFLNILLKNQYVMKVKLSKITLIYYLLFNYYGTGFINFI